MEKRGRPKGERVRVRCAAGEKCIQPDQDGGGGWMEKLPSEVARATSGRVFHDVDCRIAGGARVAKMLTGVCQYEHCPGPREFTYPAKYPRERKFHHECYLAHRRNQVETKCQWCGKTIQAAASKNRTYCATEAPEPECGWPEGVRMTCTQLGQYVNLVEPLKFVNGKPMRYWINRNRVDDRRAMVWDPDKGDGGAWEFEHRYNWQKHSGLKLEPGMHVHHVEGDKANNDPDHLEQLSASAHARLHGAQTRALRQENERLRARLAELEANQPDPHDQWDEVVPPHHRSTRLT